jgi:hypothetical protein
MYDMRNIQDIKENIYITNYEEIKPNVYALINRVLCKTELLDGKIVSRQLLSGATMDICKGEYSEIILTTDQDLIKDGVQDIDDEFLEWFVKNPSCEEVEVEMNQGRYYDYGGNVHITNAYKIIIPKEELDYTALLQPVGTKQETLEEVAELESVENKCVAGCKHFYGKEVKHHKDCFYYPESFSKMYDDLEWQQKQDKNKYNEEEMLKMLHKFGFDYTYNYKGEKTIYEWIPEWFEEYKRLLTI